MAWKFYDVYYTDEKGEILSNRLMCHDKSEARRVFYQNCRCNGKIMNIMEVTNW